MPQDLGGGSQQDVTIVTNGRVRMRHSGTDAHTFHDVARADPDSGPVTFFRDDGTGKKQYCVRFPSGAVQILATEP